MIEKLTPEQEALMPQYVEKWVNRGLSTERFDVEFATPIVNAFQTEILQREKTPVVVVDNPLEAWVGCNLIENGNANVDDIADLREQIKDFFSQPIEMQKQSMRNTVWPHQDGSFFSSTFSLYDYMRDVVGVTFSEEINERYNIWEATSHLGPIFPLDNICFVSQKPTSIKMNEENQLHCDGGPAIVIGWL